MFVDEIVENLSPAMVGNRELCLQYRRVDDRSRSRSQKVIRMEVVDSIS